MRESRQTIKTTRDNNHNAVTASVRFSPALSCHWLCY